MKLVINWFSSVSLNFEQFKVWPKLPHKKISPFDVQHTQIPQNEFLSIFQSPELPLSSSSSRSLSPLNGPQSPPPSPSSFCFCELADEMKNSSAKCERKASFHVHKRLSISLINLNGFHFLSSWLWLNILFFFLLHHFPFFTSPPPPPLLLVLIFFWIQFLWRRKLFPCRMRFSTSIFVVAKL